MRKFFLLALLLPLIIACEHAVVSQRKAIAARERKLIQQHTEEIRKLKTENERREEQERRLADVRQPGNPAQKPASDKQHVTVSKKDGELHYFNGTTKIAIRISPWENDRRTVTCYNRQGEATYTFQDVRLSHTESTTVESFHPNGAVSRIRHSSNPGGSRYMYETAYWFDADNYPLKKEEHEYPESVQLDPGSGTRLWDRATKTWK